jgi:hypothetical protein
LAGHLPGPSLQFTLTPQVVTLSTPERRAIQLGDALLTIHLSADLWHALLTPHPLFSRTAVAGGDPGLQTNQHHVLDAMRCGICNFPRPFRACYLPSMIMYLTQPYPLNTLADPLPTPQASPPRTMFRASARNPDSPMTSEEKIR